MTSDSEFNSERRVRFQADLGWEEQGTARGAFDLGAEPGFGGSIPAASSVDAGGDVAPPRDNSSKAPASRGAFSAPIGVSMPAWISFWPFTSELMRK